MNIRKTKGDQKGKGRQKSDDLVGTIEVYLRLGEFISYGKSWDFVGSLERVKERIDGLLVGERSQAGRGDKVQAGRVCELYEVFLAGCYEKAEEIDDSSGNFGMFFQELFCGWVKARQVARYDSAKTVADIVGWLDRDKYGFCHDLDGPVSLVLDEAGGALFQKHLEDRFEVAFGRFADQKPRIIWEYSTAVHMTARRLKAVYVAQRAVEAYVALCERALVSPKDCEDIARLYKAKGRAAKAMVWVDRGLAAAAGTQRWGMENSHGLERLRRELLPKVGRKEDAVQSAWSQFVAFPSISGYKELMRYVPRPDREEWHRKAMAAARDGELSLCIDLCVEMKEIDLLAERVDAAVSADLESISHYTTEKAAAVLERQHGPLAAKLYCAMAMRIVDAGKSKYYSAALEHLQSARELYHKQDQEPAWQAVVTRLRTNHPRKSGFMASFEDIAAGNTPPAAESFATRARNMWRKQTSGGGSN